MNSKLVVPLTDFADEIRQDLPRLIKDHPRGIRISVLQEEYGETPIRIIRACNQLQELGYIRYVEGVPSYIIPQGYTPPDARPYQDLTDLQRRLLLILASTTTPPNLVKTSYAQISRLLRCSTGGARSALVRLQDLGYIAIVQNPIQGKAATVVCSVNPDKIAVAQEKPT